MAEQQAPAHTRGPWRVGGDSDGELWITGADETKAVICDVVSRDGRGPEPEDEANAALIAAAPDLLTAAQHASNALAGYIERIEASGEMTSLNYGRAVLNALAAAIARAESRTPEVSP